MTVDFSTLWQAVDKGGVIAITLFLVVAFIKGWIIPRWAYVEKTKDCDFYQQVAFRGTELADRATRVAEKKVASRDRKD